MAPRTQTEIDNFQEQRQKDIDEIKGMVRHMEEVVITGNGEPALREQVRSIVKWQDENKDIPGLTRDTARFVGFFGRFVFVLMVALIGTFVTTGCGIFIGVIILLSRNNLLP